MYSFLETSDNDLYVSILEALHIKHRLGQCKPNQFYEIILFDSSDFITTTTESFKRK